MGIKPGNGTKNGTVIGLTGPMCAGKNAAGEILSRKGFLVLDTDIVAHQALRDVAPAVLAEFGPIAEARGIALVATDGDIDRRALGSLLFSDPALLARHESIIYPRINQLIDEYIDASPDSVVVINAPLLHKSPVLDRCSFVIFVSSCVAIRFIRALRRDKLPILQIFTRFYAQKHLFAQYLAKSVDIQKVNNHGTTRVLEKELDKLLALRGY